MLINAFPSGPTGNHTDVKALNEAVRSLLLSLVGENGMAFVPLPPSKENPGVSHSLGLRNGKTRGSRIIGIRVTGNEQERYEEVRCSELRLRRDSGYWY